MDMLTTAQDREFRRKLIDLLKGRHTFECTGVKLYEKVIERLTLAQELPGERSHVSEYQGMLATLMRIRDQEQEHADWLERQIEKIGGDPRKKTELSYLVEQEATGIQDVILYTESRIPYLFHGLLQAELADNAGWELLIALAQQAGDERTLQEFQKRKAEEDEHLMFARQAVARFTMEELLPQHVQV